MACRPNAVTLQGWALVLQDDGREELHIHPKSWLSAVYYVRVPKSLGRGTPGGGPRGWFPWRGTEGGNVVVFPRLGGRVQT